MLYIYSAINYLLGFIECKEDWLCERLFNNNSKCMAIRIITQNDEKDGKNYGKHV